MRTLSRRVRANLYYLRRPAREFLPVFLGMTLVVLIGGLCFTGWEVEREGSVEKLSFLRALFITYCLIFMEHLLPFPEGDFPKQFFYVLLPPLGMVVILDGIVRFSYHILRRDEASAEWCYAMAKTMRNHIVLFGLGKLGLRVLQQLLRLGEIVIVVEKDPFCPNIAYARRQGVPVRIAAGREDGLFEELNIEQAKSLIMATSDDLVNLEAAIDARAIKPEIRVVLRMFDEELANKIKESMDIHLAFSAWQLAAPLFATASFDRSIINAFYVADELMVVARIVVNPDSKLLGQAVGELRDDHGVIVLDHHRDGDSRFIPQSDLRLNAGDGLTIQTRPSTLKRIHEINQDPV